MSASDLIERVTEVVTIPTLPRIAQRLRALLADPAAGMPEVAAVVREDPAIAAKVLRVSNSAIYGQRSPITSIERAAAVLGKGAMQNLVLQAVLIREFDHLRETSFDIAAHWRHAIHTARICERIAEECPARLCTPELRPTDYYTLGLLHDLGEIILLGQFREAYVELLAGPELSARELAQREAEAFAISHTQIGSVVASQWSLPRAITSSIEIHHARPSTIGANLTALVVRGADTLSLSILKEGKSPKFLPPDDCGRIGMNGDVLRRLVVSATRELTDIDV